MDLLQGSEVFFGASAGRDRLHFTLSSKEEVAADSIARQTASENKTHNYLGESTGDVEDGYGPLLVGEMDLARLNDGAFHLAQATAVAEALLAQGVDIELSNSSKPLLWPPSAHQQLVRFSGATLPISSSATKTLPPPAFILDLCGAWGVAGLLVAQLERRDGMPATQVLAIAENHEAAAALNALAKENGLAPDRYRAIADRLVDLASRGGVIEGPLHDRSDDFSALTGHDRDKKKHCQPALESRPLFRNKWAVVMASSLVEGSGLLKQGGLGDLELCRKLIDSEGGERSGDKSLPPNSFIPGSLDVICQGLQRASLLSENRVRSESCCGVDVDPINAFGVANFRELDLSAASSEAEAATVQKRCGISTKQGHIGKAWTNGGCADDGGEGEEMFLTAPVVCYALELANVQAGPDGCLPHRSTRLLVQRDGTLHAIAYWYRQHLGSVAGSGGSAIVLDTGPSVNIGDTPSSSHFRQAAVLLQDPVVVTAGQVIDLRVFCNTSQGVIIQVLGTDETGQARSSVDGSSS